MIGQTMTVVPSVRLLFFFFFDTPEHHKGHPPPLNVFFSRQLPNCAFLFCDAVSALQTTLDSTEL